MVGETFSHYRILEGIGEYRLGAAYRAQDLLSDRPVALQVIENARRPEMPAARTLLAFRTPVAAVLDAGRTERGVWIASELPEGNSLKTHLQALKAAGQSLPGEAVIQYAIQVVVGMAHLHKHGIRHGNLHSGCIMRGQGPWRITALDVLGLVSDGPIGDADIRRDIASVGELIQELATGESASGSIVPALPPELVPIVRSALAASPQEGYEDMDRLLLDLDRLPAGQLTQPLVAAQVRSDWPDTRRISQENCQFRPGQLVSDRFRIIRFVARGGMGEVYEAEDLELREHVALKTVRSEVAADPPAVERFRREIQIARRITHPNVCRIFDLFRHPAAASQPSESRVLFLTMELLDGRTLADRIRRSGPLDPAEALPIIAQLATGLEAAHSAGIIHRDFKSANVILTEGDRDNRSRAVITDFGLARPVVPAADATVSLAGAGISGTPAYMAPEQVRGSELTPASDVYAFGVVIYEMMTGTLPFADTTPLATAAKRLHESPVNPRVHRPELSELWERVILRCLEREQERRFQRATEVVEALTDRAALVDGVQINKRPSRPFAIPRKWLIAAAAAIATILALVAGVNSLRVHETGKSRPSVAVLGFRNLAGASEAAWLSNAFSEMLTTELSAGEKLRTVPGESVARMKVDLELGEVGTSLARDTLARIRSYLGSDVIAFGSYVVVGEKGAQRIRLDLRLQDARTGDLLKSATEEAPATELLSLVARAGASLRRQLGVAPLSSEEMMGLRASLPSNQEAARLYTEGLSRLRLFDASEARQLLQKAVETDPEFALARSALATSWAMSGYAQRAKAEAKAAMNASARLQREDRLLVEARCHEAAGEWAQAAESYRTLFGFFPDNLEYGLRLAGTRTSAGKAREALSTLDALRKLPPPDRDSPRIDLAEARAAGAIADYHQQQKAATAAIAKAESQGARLLAAGARLLEGTALKNLGDLRQSAVVLERARADYLKARDRWGAANAANNLAVVRAKSGDLAKARRDHEDSLALYRQLGDRSGEAAALSSLANLLRTQGDLVEARRLHTEALGIYRETGDRLEEAKALNNVANALASAGELPDAKKMYDAAMPIFKESGDENAVGTILTNLAGIRFDEGDLAGAADLYEQARVVFERIGVQSSLAFVLYRLGDLDLSRGNVSAGREHHEKALGIRTQLGERGGVAESRLALAEVALYQNRAAAAEALAREALQEFRRENRQDDEAMGRSVLARALLGQRRIDEAWEEARSARTQAEGSANQAMRLVIQTTVASVQATLGNTKSAAELLQRVINEARRSALPVPEFEARLALGQVEISGGNLSAGRARLAALEREAAAKGYAGIAQRAAERQK